MFTINKTLVATAAVIAVGFVAALDMAQSRTGTSAAASVAARFPAEAEMMLTVSLVEPPAAKSDKDSGECTREHWPYITDECLSSNSNANVKRPARTITISRPVADNVSQLMRVSITEVASH